MFLAGSAITAGFIMAGKSFADFGDRIMKMSQRTGIGAEELSKLDYAAALSGTSLEGLETAVRRMHRTIYDAEKTMGTARYSLDQIGVSVEDLKKLSPEDRFFAIAEGLANVRDKGRQAALAQEIFGRSGTEMLPMLENGAAGLREMMNEAETFGYVLTEKAGKGAVKLKDDIERLSRSFQALRLQIGEEAMPYMERFAGKALDIIKVLNEMDPELRGNAIRFVMGAGAALTLTGALVYTGATIKAITILSATATPVIKGMGMALSGASLGAAALAGGLKSVVLLGWAVAEIVYRIASALGMLTFGALKHAPGAPEWVELLEKDYARGWTEGPTSQAVQKLIGFSPVQMLKDFREGMQTDPAGLEDLRKDGLGLWDDMIPGYKHMADSSAVIGERREVHIHAQFEKSEEVFTSLLTAMGPEYE